MAPGKDQIQHCTPYDPWLANAAAKEQRSGVPELPGFVEAAWADISHAALHEKKKAGSPEAVCPDPDHSPQRDQYRHNVRYNELHVIVISRETMQI